MAAEQQILDVQAIIAGHADLDADAIPEGTLVDTAQEAWFMRQITALGGRLTADRIEQFNLKRLQTISRYLSSSDGSPPAALQALLTTFEAVFDGMRAENLITSGVQYAVVSHRRVLSLAVQPKLLLEELKANTAFEPRL